MMFSAPLVLLALVLLPLLWWLLRATPPAPRAQNFPAIRLLAGLRPREETPARTPWWLLALRLCAAALIIAGLAGPVLGGGGGGLPGRGPVLIAIDNGWAAAPDWAARLAAANAVLDRAERQGRRVSLLATAAAIEAPRATPPQPAALLRPVLAALAPQPWAPDRQAAALAVAAVPAGPTAYVADGVAARGDATFAAALTRRGAVTEFRGTLPARLLTAAAGQAGLTAILHQIPVSVPRQEQVLAETGDGRVLARTPLSLAPGAGTGTARIDLPPELRNQLGALRLAGAPGAGSVALLDEASRRRPVGLLSTGASETPLLGADFYVDRALAPYAELRHGDAQTLLARPLSVLVAADQALEGPDAARIDAWVRHGGFLIRFAGPGMGHDGDTLLPEKLLQNDRQLGGAMSWSQPQHLAAFPPGPFAGLPAPQEVTVNRQVLAEPSAALPGATWAALADGTPLVTAAAHGDGEVVLFHVTANADWSNLPLSGLFVDMLRRLVQRAAGVAGAGETGPLPPLQTLDGAGVLGPPPAGAQVMTPGGLGADAASPRHPPGFYGLAQDRHAFNLGGHTPLAAGAPVAGATVLILAASPHAVRLGPGAIALALGLLLADMLLTLRLRGLLRPAVAALLVMAALQAGHAQGQAQAQLQLETPGEAPNGTPGGAGPISAQDAALNTHLAYVVTGDGAIDGVSKSGLSGLSDYVNDHTAATLAAPVGVSPGRDDLSFYPLIYWAVAPDAAVTPAFTASLNDYMRHGGIVVIDTRSGGEGGAFAPGADAALRRVSAGLDVPALAPLTNAHVLARAFYLLSEFPGRYEGATVWVQRDQDRSNDSVSPVIIGANDWAAAWAVDDDGRPLFATIPGGQRQRTLAWRFGVNLVMYALTGNYKGDQVHVPAILQRLGQ
jgi:hypothetical protein